jgi:hypothetical protein
MGTLNITVSKEYLDEECECGGEFNPYDRMVCMRCGKFNPKLYTQVKSPFDKDFIDRSTKEDISDIQDMKDQRAGIIC